jgi:hypothetical protein
MKLNKCKVRIYMNIILHYCSTCYETCENKEEKLLDDHLRLLNRLFMPNEDVLEHKT